MKKHYDIKKEEKKESKKSEMDETLEKMQISFKPNQYIVTDCGTSTLKMGLSG